MQVDLEQSAGSAKSKNSSFDPLPSLPSRPAPQFSHKKEILLCPNSSGPSHLSLLLASQTAILFIPLEIGCRFQLKLAIT